MICTSLLSNVDIAVIIIRPRALRCSLLQMSVGVSVEHIGEFCKKQLSRSRCCVGCCLVSKELCIRWGPDHPMEGALFLKKTFLGNRHAQQLIS